MIGRTGRRLAATGVLILALGAGAQAQIPRKGGSSQFVTIDEPNIEETRGQFQSLLARYPPNLRNVFRQDPTLLSQETYLASYPALANYLKAHPEIVLNPSFYLGGLAGSRNETTDDHATQVVNMWRNFLQDLTVFAGFAMAACLIGWLIRTFVDYRRWNRLSRVQAEVHTKLLDRFSTNDEIMAYINSAAGAKFLQSAPISLDTGTRTMGAPLSRIMWSLQAGLVLAAAGIGMQFASGSVPNGDGEPLHVMGIIALSLGVGFAVSAGVSYLLSQKLGLFDVAAQKRLSDPPEVQQ